MRKGEQEPHKTGKTSSRGGVSIGTSQDCGDTSNIAKIISSCIAALISF